MLPWAHSHLPGGPGLTGRSEDRPQGLVQHLSRGWLEGGAATDAGQPLKAWASPACATGFLPW